MAKRHELSTLEAALGHVFADKELLEQALTHVSLHSGQGKHYQRLEFLGDRVLGLVVAEMLHAEFPDATEGELSRRLAHLVRRETCAEVASAWGVAPFIRLGSGEKRSGLRNKDPILADVCEALIAAVHLDAGFDVARDLVRRTFGPKMAEPGRAVRDPKSLLQEWALARGLPVPTYQETARSGPDHAPVFRIAAIVKGFDACEAEGLSKRAAEREAAAAFLAREGVDGDRA